MINVYSCIDVSNYFIKKSIVDNKRINVIKLQCIVYMTHSFYLVKNNGNPLLLERIECHTYGARITKLYKHFAKHGNDPIYLDRQPTFIFDENAIDVMDSVWDMVNDLNMIQMANWSHNDESPWKRAKDENLSIIPDSYLMEYFKQFVG